VKKGLKIIPVGHVDEVMAQALVRRPEPIEWVEPPEGGHSPRRRRAAPAGARRTKARIPPPSRRGSLPTLYSRL
jgi:ATP-dependent Lon protease